MHEPQVLCGQAPSQGGMENQPILVGFHPMYMKYLLALSSFHPRLGQAPFEVSRISVPFIPCLCTESTEGLILRDLICFFQEKFQESLKKLKNEEQEAEKLTAFIREKKICWKARGTFSEDVLGQESWQVTGAEGKGVLVLSVL